MCVCLHMHVGVSLGVSLLIDFINPSLWTENGIELAAESDKEQ